MSEYKILGETVEEFMVRWNAVTFQIGGLSGQFARKLSRLLINEFKGSLQTYGINLQDFFINMSRGGSISTKQVPSAPSPAEIREFYRFNLWGTSIPYTLPIVLEMNSNLERKTVLDVGCGFGRLSLLCALRGAARVVAVDLSDPLIQSLDRTKAHLRLNNMETYIMDAETLEFESNQFDIIYCCEVIEHLPNPANFLKTAHMLLKPNGKLILSTPNGLNMVGFKQAFLRFFHYKWISPYGAGQPELHMFTPMSLRTLISNCGFKLETFRGAELLDNLAIPYPGAIAVGILQFLPLLFPAFQKIKNGLVRLGKTRFFKNFGLEMFVSALPQKR